MIVDFKGLLDEMEEDDVFTIANEARPGTNYLWNDVLPEKKRPGYYAKAGSMTVRATMAELTAMDSRYKRGGVSERRNWEHYLAKLGQEMPFSEEYIRELRALVEGLMARNIDGHEQLLETMFNFVDKLLTQPQLDSAEWMRSQAIIFDEIDWWTDDIHLEVSYGRPAENFLPTRTGTAAYDQSASEFWNDWKSAQRILNNRVRAVYAHTNTINGIMYNPANAVKVVKFDDIAGVYTFVRYSDPDTQLVSEDRRDVITLYAYDDEGEVLSPDPVDRANGETIKLPFCPPGSIVFVGAYDNRKFTIGSGSTDDSADTPVTLGYTHVGPTEEGNGRLGRWARTYVPEDEPWSFIGQSAANVLPVIDAPERIVTATTDLT